MSSGVSILDKSIIFVGNFISEGTIDISGGVKGNVISNVVLIKDNGYVKGSIYANEVVISNGGNVNGSIFAKNVKMLKGAEVPGKVSYTKFSIEDGAKLLGTCDFIDENGIENELHNIKDKLDGNKELKEVK